MVVSCRLPFAIGNDIAKCSRFYKQGDINSAQVVYKICQRFLRPQEIAGVKARFPNWFNSLDNTDQSSSNIKISDFRPLSEHLAGRWAAKEAAKKAWGANKMSFRDLEIRSEVEGQGKIYILCDPFIHDSTVDDSDKEPSEYAQTALLSISHDGDYAMATVIAEPLNQPLADALLKAKREHKKNEQDQPTPLPSQQD